MSATEMIIRIIPADNGATVEVSYGDTVERNVYEFDEENITGLVYFMYRLKEVMLNNGKFDCKDIQIKEVHGSKYDCKDNNCKICEGG